MMLLFGRYFLFITRAVIIWAMVLKKFPVVFLFHPCAQSRVYEMMGVVCVISIVCPCQHSTYVKVTEVGLGIR